MKVVVVAAGSRGDVQPQVALATGLARAGHSVRVLTSSDFRGLVEDHGLEFWDIGGSTEAVANEMQQLLEHGNFLKILKHMREAAGELALVTARRGLPACEGADLIVSGLGGLFVAVAIAEKLDVRFVPAYSYPFTPTRQFPSVLVPVPQTPFTSWLNPISHRVGQQMIWQTVRSADNAARREVLGLPASGIWGPYRRWQRERGIVLYGYSPHVLPTPRDWGSHCRVTGYWFLDEPEEWQPPDGLVDFLEAGPPPIYVGFGSMGSRDAEKMADIVVEALRLTGQRGVLSSGWGGLKKGDLPDEVFMVGSVPHSWLFPRMAAVVHHGGAGTTAAGMRAGVPSVITPVMGDQPFWARTAHALGVSPKPVRRRDLTVGRLARALGEVTSDASMRGAAAALGEQIRREDGVSAAVEVLTSTQESARA